MLFVPGQVEDFHLGFTVNLSLLSQASKYLEHSAELN